MFSNAANIQNDSEKHYLTVHSGSVMKIRMKNDSEKHYLAVHSDLNDPGSVMKIYHFECSRHSRTFVDFLGIFCD